MTDHFKQGKPVAGTKDNSFAYYLSTMLVDVKITSIRGVESRRNSRFLPDDYAVGTVFDLPTKWFGENTSDGSLIHAPMFVKMQVTNVEEADSSDSLPLYSFRQISEPFSYPEGEAPLIDTRYLEYS